MGGPIASFIVEVFMNRLVQWIFRHARFANRVISWYRYVDDVFCIWQGTDFELQHFHHQLHSFDENIRFTIEIGNRTLNYLDLTISLAEDNLNDGMLTPEFSVYRKDTFTAVSIHQNSWHPTYQNWL